MTYPPVVLTTLPKSGTNLLNPLLFNLLSKHNYCRKLQKQALILNTPAFISRLSNWEYTASHFKAELFENLPQTQCYKIILLVRDLRDVYVSSYFFHRYWAGINVSDIMLFFRRQLDQLNWSDETAIRKLITGQYLSDLDFGYHFDFLGSSYEFVKAWTGQVQNCSFYIVKYEDLINKRVKTVKKIMDYIGLQVRISEIEYAIHSTDIFKLEGRKRGDVRKEALNRRGGTGEWRQYFDKQAKQVCKDRIGNLLIDLGYESDFDW